MFSNFVFDPKKIQYNLGQIYLFYFFEARPDSLRGEIFLIDRFFDKIQSRVKLDSVNSKVGNAKKKQRLETLSETDWGNSGTYGQGAKENSIGRTEASTSNHL